MHSVALCFSIYFMSKSAIFICIKCLYDSTMFMTSVGTSGGFSSVSSSPDLGISTGDVIPEDMDTRTRGDGCIADEGGTVTGVCGGNRLSQHWLIDCNQTIDYNAALGSLTTNSTLTISCLYAEGEGYNV